jgi:hypothetical protein
MIGIKSYSRLLLIRAKVEVSGEVNDGYEVFLV